MLKSGFLIVSVLALAACVQRVPDSGAGVGFDDYNEYQLERARREAAGVATIAVGPVISDEGSGGPAISSSDLAAAGIGTGEVGAPLSAIDRTPGLEADPSNPVPGQSSNPAISDEQDFDAVASRESIESDAERLAAAAAARQEAEVTALPTRTGDAGPNIVAYALNAPNALGQEWYSRSILSGQNRFQRNCAQYNTPDAAQRDFLARGGPERDPRGLDPDGDGFACGWDPEPFRLAAGN